MTGLWTFALSKQALKDQPELPKPKPVDVWLFSWTRTTRIRFHIVAFSNREIHYGLRIQMFACLHFPDSLHRLCVKKQAKTRRYQFVFTCVIGALNCDSSFSISTDMWRGWGHVIGWNPKLIKCQIGWVFIFQRFAILKIELISLQLSLISTCLLSYKY